MTGQPNKRMETDERRPAKMEAPFAAHPQRSTDSR